MSSRGEIAKRLAKLEGLWYSLECESGAKILWILNASPPRRHSKRVLMFFCQNVREQLRNLTCDKKGNTKYSLTILYYFKCTSKERTQEKMFGREIDQLSMESCETKLS